MTALDFMNKTEYPFEGYSTLDYFTPEIYEHFEKIMIEFAKYHVKKALESAYGDGSISCGCDSWESCNNRLCEEDIIGAYPLDLIN